MTSRPPSTQTIRISRNAMVLAVGVSLILTGCASQTVTVEENPPARGLKTLTPQQRQANVESFDMVWTTIRDKHFDPKLNGVDWDSARAELRPKVESAETMAQARAVMMRLIGKLGQTHFGILPSEIYNTPTRDAPTGEVSRAVEATADAAKATSPSPSGSSKPTGPGTVGMDVRPVNGKVYVTRVVPGSPADHAGVKMGWELVAVGEMPVRAVMDFIHKSPSSGSIPAHVKQAREATELVSVSPGLKTHFGFLDAQDKARVVSLTGQQPAGFQAKFGNLPPVQLELRRERLPGNVGYIYLSIWFDPVRTVQFMDESLREFKDASGIIIDVRGNPGGMGALATTVGSYFVTDGKQELGTLMTRQYKQKFVMNPRPTPYLGPVAILVDELSMSTSEIFAGGMRDIGRAKVFGTPTPGAALPSLIEKLPNGDGFQYAFANYVSASGEELEGKGVKPDIQTTLHRATLLKGIDPAVEAATEWIRTAPMTRKISMSNK